MLSEFAPYVGGIAAMLASLSCLPPLRKVIPRGSTGDLSLWTLVALTDWQTRFVSAYASVHPWEGFAETWAHYLHIVDTLEMAGNFGMRIRPITQSGAELSADIDFDPYSVVHFSRVVDACCHLSLQ